jgi:protein-L-isoaspartate(D-aspartate) O-methyltransferase
MPDFAALREAMIERHIAARGIDDPAILAAFRDVPREAFVEDSLAAHAYDDGPLPIGNSQTISQPYIVALMIAAAGVQPEDKVLEVGAGSGYATALISRIADKVIAIERVPELAQSARERLATLGYGNVEIVEADGTLGWRDAAPYDDILVAAAASQVPQPLIDQLKPGGRLVMPVGGIHGIQELIKVTKDVEGYLSHVTLGGVRFVPLISDGGS